jgi:hypothetical protein
VSIRLAGRLPHPHVSERTFAGTAVMSGVGDGLARVVIDIAFCRATIPTGQTADIPAGDGREVVEEAKQACVCSPCSSPRERRGANAAAREWRSI